MPIANKACKIRKEIKNMETGEEKEIDLSTYDWKQN